MPELAARIRPVVENPRLESAGAELEPQPRLGDGVGGAQPQAVRTPVNEPGPAPKAIAARGPSIIERIRRYFREVRTDPLGCASLAQAYYVVLKSGRPAVVKIQRPGVQQAMLDDMDLLAALVRRLAKRMPDFNDVMDLEAMLDVVFSSMRPELDFTIEAENMDDFRDRIEDFDLGAWRKKKPWDLLVVRNRDLEEGYVTRVLLPSPDA